MLVAFIPAETFDALFADSIGLLFNWRRFRRESWPVELGILKTFQEIGNLYVPRYTGALHDGSAKARQIKDIRVYDERVLGLAHEFASNNCTWQFVVPAYRLKVKKRTAIFLMDGTHKLMALHACNSVRFRVALFVVHGPNDEPALWDTEMMRN